MVQGCVLSKEEFEVLASELERMPSHEICKQDIFNLIATIRDRDKTIAELEEMKRHQDEVTLDWMAECSSLHQQNDNLADIIHARDKTIERLRGELKRIRDIAGEYVVHIANQALAASE